MQRTALLITLVVLGGLLLTTAAIMQHEAPGDHRDAVFTQASTWADSVRSYTQHASIETMINERPFTITSTRSIHPFQNTASSTIVTRVSLAEPAGTYSYTVRNRRTTTDIYTQVETPSAELEPRIPVTNGWRHFKHGDVTQRFQRIAPTGVVVDPLSLFRDGAAAVSVLNEPERVEHSGTSTQRYTITLADSASVPAGAASLVPYLRRGTTSVWISEDVPQVHKLSIEAPDYAATINLSEFNSVATVTPPVSPPSHTMSPQ
jgi:hypothetical protein